MLNRSVGLVVAAVFFMFQFWMGTALAAELDEATRTVALNEAGDTVILSRAQLEKGQKLFNYACAQCHVRGITKQNPTLDLSPKTLALANPSRDNLEGMMDYIKDPTTYDGFESIAELHPSLKSADIFPKMRNLSEDDIEAIAGHVLVQPKVLGDRWGGGKIYF